MSRENQRPAVVVVGNGMVGYKLCEYLVDTRTPEQPPIVCFGEERRPAYDRVRLTSYFSGTSAEDLSLADAAWYRKNRINLYLGDPVVRIDRDSQVVHSAKGRSVRYESLVLATGSAPFVPPVSGTDLTGVFVYRTIEDLDAIRAYGEAAQSAAVVGGGLLGLEAAKALYDLGLDTHIVEFAPGLMMRQLDPAGAGLLAAKIRQLGVRVHLAKNTRRIVAEKNRRVFEFHDGERLEVDMVVLSAGIRPRDEAAAACGLELGTRGGVAVDDRMCSSDPNIFAVGECASHNGMVYGLVAPGYQMADVAAAQISGVDKRFSGADLSTKLKLMGVDVASIGESTASDEQSSTYITVRDDLEGVYRKLIVNEDTGALRGAVLVGDVSAYGKLLQVFRSGEPLPHPPISLIVQGGEVACCPDVGGLDDSALLCTCNNVTKGDIVSAVGAGTCVLGDLKKVTTAGTGCGGCLPQLRQLLDVEMRRRGCEIRTSICNHFALTRQELYQAVKIHKFRTFEEIIVRHGEGKLGCEVCKPVVASILASIYNEAAIQHQEIQDTNDRFLANIQKGGTYSVVPRIPGGEITPDALMTLGAVAKRFDLYVKVTGAQRIDMFGARVDQLPDIWEELVAAGFESGHAYAKGMRTVKSCVGSTWCRFGVLDSVGFAIRIENRYKGLRAPHKLKSAVSGCIRECAEARSKDFGVIATAEGWNLYVGGNGGARPKHGELLATGLDDDSCIALIDRFLMFYIHTAEPLMRTAGWLEALEGGIAYLREVVVEDRLGICEQLEADLQVAVDAYECEWARVVKSPDLRARFRSFVNTDERDPTQSFLRERNQKLPASGGGRLTERSPRASGVSVVEETVHV